MPKERFLILARHGEKGCERGLQDIDQPLTHLGISQCRMNGTLLLQNHIIPDFFLCSGVDRAVQSLRYLRDQFAGFYDLPDPVYCKYDLYKANNRDDIGRLIARHVPENALCAMIMGHNPGIHDLASELGRNSIYSLYQHIEHEYRSSTTCVFRFTGEGWWDLDAKTCELMHVFTGSYPLLHRDPHRTP